MWQRDGGQCTFTATNGHRSPARTMLEYDHIEPVARGGQSAVDNLRLRCRAHNRLAAERAFGSSLMREKRRAAEKARALESPASPHTRADEIVPWLRSLGCKAGEAKRAAEAACDELPGAPIEDLIKRAISCFGRRPRCVNERVPQPAA